MNRKITFAALLAFSSAISVAVHRVIDWRGGFKSILLSN